MAQSFGEYTSPTDTIAAILGTYPFSIGLFRELVQNSDDAKATKQMFVMDIRTHGTTSLFHPHLADTQGPALLAYNDTTFSEDDWEAIQSIHRSSKKSDVSKIGKYGIGFRSCYHLTDHPQILSNSSLAILDPQHTFSDSGGAKFDVKSYPSHLSAFESFTTGGSVIRLPLRLEPSLISKQVVTADEIRTLFTDYIREELAITLLFLKHVRRIEIWEVDLTGSRTCMAAASVSKHLTGEAAYKARVDIDGASSHEWRILQSSFAGEESASLLSQRLGRDARPLLRKHKLFPNMAIAVPLGSDLGTSFGRLFTHLPLPIRTGFPCHVHGLFALTQSRQNLSNKSEVGVVKGSDDSVLIEWNQMLFDEYLPRIWAAMLRLVVEIDNFGAKEVYRLWPRLQAHVETGDSLYWTELPAKLISSITSEGSPVWPIIPHEAEPAVFLPLSRVYVASDATEPTALQSLANTSLSIAKPPEYILQLLCQTKTQFTTLTPKVAHGAMLDKISALEGMNTTEHLALLEYLLSSENLDYVIGLPIIPLTGRKRTALQLRNTPQAVHILLDDQASEIWSHFDDSAISLKNFSSAVRDLLVRPGPVIFNVQLLTPERVVEYLTISPFGLDFSCARHMASVNEVIILWLSKFWAWIGKWTEQKGILFPMLASFYLLPTRTGLLASPEEGIFDDDGLDRQVVVVLQQFGIAFLHTGFSLAAKDVVGSFSGALLSPSTDIHALLDRLSVPPQLRLNAHVAQMLLNFILQAVLDHCRATPLSESQQTALRSLPIFPVLTPSSRLESKKASSSRLFSTFRSKAPKTNTTKAVKAIPPANRVFGVNEATSMLLPLGDDMTFLDGSAIDLALLAHLNPENSVPLTEVDVVGLALAHFPDQSKFLQNAFMEYMVQHRESLPPRLMSILRSVKFIPTLDGSLQSLEHVIDPLSPLTMLYSGSEDRDRVPRCADEDVVAMLQQLRTLGVLREALNSDIMYERIQQISANANVSTSKARALSIKLMDLLYTSGFDVTQLEIPVDAKWVPTNSGMLGHEECLDRGLHRPELFDEVFPLVDDAVKISHSLRIALGWDKPLSLATLMQQLGLVIARSGTQPEKTYKKMRVLIKELSLRELLEDDLLTLRNITSDMPWIPISSLYIATTSHAVFNLPLALRGFYEIPLPLAERPEIKAFLVRMGCTERPSTSILVAELRKLKDQPPSNEKLQAALRILKALPMEMSEEERDAILVPDIYCNMHPSKEVYFNDIGERAFLEAGDLVLAHPRLDDHIARRLHMARLGLKFLHLKNPGLDMGEKLTTTIRNTLKQYTEQQTLTEFFANASDAGATRLKILVDDAQAPADRLLCPTMAPFQRCPSLVIYNDSVFTQADFDGICMTGVGGKEGRTDTIGQFGLGALSMFHFTELGMIVSGEKVLFLNPSKTHLPLQDCASLLLPLQQMQRLYPDHLTTLDGLFGFELSKTTTYNGTIFRLPLRGDSHIGENAILQTVRDSEYVRDQIVRPYWRTAQQSLLFSKINSVATYYRTASRRVIRGWSLKANRGEVVKDPEGGFSRQALQVTGYPSPDVKPGHDVWQIVYATLPISQLPSEYHLLREPHRLRTLLVTGFAARTSSESWQSHHNLFSTLPLPMTTTLPVHLTAPFILTPDRRHIRFDDYDNMESKYNRWLLSAIAPPLYLYLLETLHHLVGHNDQWWPGNTMQQDAVTRVLVESFYSWCLPNTSLKVCTSHFNPLLKVKPSDAIILGSEPEEVRYILQCLRLTRYVVFPPIIQQRCLSSMKMFDQDVLQVDLALHAFRLISLFEKGDISIKHIEATIRYFQEDTNANRLLFLPLVPLFNGTLAPLNSYDYKNKLYVLKSSQTSIRLFAAKDLVHPDFEGSLLLERGYNVSSLKTNEFVNLIRPILPEQMLYDTTDPSQDEWISNFWQEYASLGLNPNLNGMSFPLIPTLRLGHYVSLFACQTNRVMVLGDDLPECVGGCLNIMGASVVARSDARLPSEISLTLHTVAAFKFDTFLKYLEPLDVSSKFALLDDESHRQFAEWCRSQVVWTSASLIPVAAKLPIWLASSGQSSSRFHHANEISVLPQSFPSGVIGSLATKPIVESSDGLRHLAVSVLPLDDFYENLNMKKGNFLDAGDSSMYKRLISALISDTSFTRRYILLPDGHRTLVPSNTLYAREPLFIAAFGSSSPIHFLHEEYIDLEARLGPFGMKTQSVLDLETFLLCATSIHDDVSSESRIQRSTSVFRAYCEELPLRVGLAEDIWKPLDKLRFIPREATRQTALRIEEYSQYTKSLPPVVSPSEILLPKFEALAWTQRALLSSYPNDRILVANSSFGMPTIPEVIQHLRVLAIEVARDYIGNKYVLSDLVTVYKWLDEHQDEIGDELITYHDEKLYLNIDDPDEDVWLWNSADEMFLNIVDSGDLKAVRKFLAPFRDLLYVGGVEEIVYPTVPQPKLSSVEAQHARLKEGYSEMRSNGVLTDVVFVSDDEERFLAHRSFLAPMSEYLKDLFCGDFTEARPASAAEPIEVAVDYSGACVKILLDFIYTGAQPGFEGLGLVTLLEILDLSGYWEFMELNEVAQARIIAGSFINPATYGDILQRATALDAQYLLNACEFYERENRDAIERMRGGIRQPRKNAKRIPKKPKTTLVGYGAPDGTNAISGKRERKPSRVTRMMHRFSTSFSRHGRSGSSANLAA